MINGIRDRAGTRGQHTFELYGDFSSWDQVRADVSCNGVATLSKVDYASRDQINVFIAEPPGDASCTFVLQSVTDGMRSPAYGPVRPSIPEIEMRATSDRGITGGRRLVELYDRCPDWTLLEPRVVCDGITVAARGEYSSLGQINISMPDAGSAPHCTFALRRTDQAQSENQDGCHASASK